MKKICYVSVNERVIFDFYYPQILKLKENKYDITLISDFDKSNKSFDIKGLRTYHVQMSRGGNPFKLFNTFVKLTRLFRKEKFDIIQYTGPSTSLVSSISGYFGGIKKRLYCQWGLRYEGFRGLKRQFFVFMELITCLFSTRIIVDSKMNREKQISRHLLSKRKSTIIYNGSTNGVDLDKVNEFNNEHNKIKLREYYKIPAKALVVGYLGRISHDKGIDDLMDAITIVNKMKTGIWFIIAGFEDEIDKISQVKKEKVINFGNTIFTGRIYNHEKYYPMFDIFVFPSYREGYGGGCLNAGAYEIPIIATSITPIYESLFFGKFGSLVPIKSPDLIAEKIIFTVDKYYEEKKKAKEYRKWIYNNFNRSDWLNFYFQEIEQILG